MLPHQLRDALVAESARAEAVDHHGDRLGATDEQDPPGDQNGPIGGLTFVDRVEVTIANLAVYVTATVLEEDCDGLCWQYLVAEEGLKPDAVVITEPTSLHVYRGQRGRMEVEISTSGVSCHGSAPARGVNAIYRMADVIEDIERLNGKLRPHEPLGKGSVTISQIRSTAPYW